MRIRSYEVQSAQLLTSDILKLSLRPKRPKDRLWFYPGQYAAIGFKKSSRPSPMRCFSIVSSPNSELLEFSMRISGDYTQALAELERGDEVFVRGPYGSFVIDENIDRNVIMLAGGIGITPFMSMIRHASISDRPTPLTLLYSNSSQDNIPFYDELLNLEKNNPRFRCAFFITGTETNRLTSARVLQGRINETRLKNLTKGRTGEFTYFICGPKKFTTQMKKNLISIGAPIDKIISEEFSVTSKLAGKGSVINRWTYGLAGASIIAATLFVMGIDLVRSVPVILSYENKRQLTTQSQAAQTNAGQSTSTQAPSSTTPTSSNSSPEATTAPTVSSPSSTSSASTPAAPAAQSYQPPISAVS